MSTTTEFCGEIRQPLSGVMYNRENHLGLAKTGLNSGVVLFSSGLNSEVFTVRIKKFRQCHNSRLHSTSVT